jgi:hypothetical protein
VLLTVVARDAISKLRDAKRSRVTDTAHIKRGLRRGDRGCRCVGPWLADFHVNHAAARRFDTGSVLHHVHDHERRHVAARRRHKQRFRTRLLSRARYPIPLRLHMPRSRLIPAFRWR